MTFEGGAVRTTIRVGRDSHNRVPSLSVDVERFGAGGSRISSAPADLFEPVRIHVQEIADRYAVPGHDQKRC
jgi:hypothetical protein